jgi:hypothetical protein
MISLSHTLLRAAVPLKTDKRGMKYDSQKAATKQ